MGKFIQFDSVPKIVGTVAVVMATMFLVYKVLPKKVRTVITGA
jgi:hypothetical protein